ncbi:MAG: HAD-IIB family hydrolase [Clostridiales bacterium]|nr:HAD-IIB family hydrolase [Clostridiales bacterium]
MTDYNLRQKKDYSDWLVVSDVDGTLNNKFRRLPQNNYQAIDRFVNTLKGNFTLASGRSVDSIEKHYLKLPLNNTPAIVLNGAGIYDFSNKKMLRFFGISDKGKEVVKKVLEKFPKLELEVCTPDHIYLVNPKLYGPILVKADNLAHTFCTDLNEIFDLAWGKVVFFALPGLLKKVMQYIKSLGVDDFNFMSSSIVTQEMLAAGVHKGKAVLALADLIGVDHKKTAAIGDYFNDYDMLKSVYLPAVCAQAPAAMHKIAKYHAVHCNKGAVADFLNFIEKTY